MKRKGPLWYGAAVVCLLASFFLGVMPCGAADILARQDAPASSLTPDETQALAAQEAANPLVLDVTSGQPPPMGPDPHFWIVTGIVCGVVVIVACIAWAVDSATHDDPEPDPVHIPR